MLVGDDDVRKKEIERATRWCVRMQRMMYIQCTESGDVHRVTLDIIGTDGILLRVAVNLVPLQASKGLLAKGIHKNER